MTLLDMSHLIHEKNMIYSQITINVEKIISIKENRLKELFGMHSIYFALFKI